MRDTRYRVSRAPRTRIKSGELFQHGIQLLVNDREMMRIRRERVALCYESRFRLLIYSPRS